MTSSAARKAKGERAELVLFEDVTNPFCGLLPDDLVVERTDQGLKVLKNGCGKSVAGFERKLPPSSPTGRRQGCPPWRGHQAGS